MDPNIIPAAEALKHNKKFIETIRMFVVYGCLLWPLSYVVEIIFSGVIDMPVVSIFSIIGLITSLVMGAVASAVAGVIFYFLYNPFHNWLKKSKFVSKHIHSMFTLFWKPFIWVNILGLAFGLLKVIGLGAITLAVTGIFGFLTFGLIGVGIFSFGWFIYFILHILIFYFYAREISAKLTPLYPW